MEDLYSNRDEYRTKVDVSDHHSFRVTVDETDLMIITDKKTDLDIIKNRAYELVVEVRKDIVEEIKIDQNFLTSFSPIPIRGDEKDTIVSMKKAGILAHVGPMAAVAGMVSEYVGKGLMELTNEVIVENGGDIFIRSSSEKVVGIYAPGSPISGKLGIKVDPSKGLGICTSSGTYGHSVSFGMSQAALVVSSDTSLADAAATRLGNMLKNSEAIEKALTTICEIEGVLSAVGIVDDKIGVLGDIHLSKI